MTKTIISYIIIGLQIIWVIPIAKPTARQVLWMLSMKRSIYRCCRVCTWLTRCMISPSFYPGLLILRENVDMSLRLGTSGFFPGVLGICMNILEQENYSPKRKNLLHGRKSAIHNHNPRRRLYHKLQLWKRIQNYPRQELPARSA
jgi:hypothetical protein